MNSNRRRISRSSNKQWEVQRGASGQLRYLLTEAGSTSVVARQSANAFCWEEPKGEIPEASNPGAEPESDEVALRRTLLFLHRAYRR